MVMKTSERRRDFGARREVEVVGEEDQNEPESERRE